MTAHTPDQMRMARRIAEDMQPLTDATRYFAYHAALAAILETSELAARLCDDEQWHMAAQLRAGEHLKDSTHD